MKAVLASAWVVLVLAGCGRMAAPPLRETVDVRGRILAGGSPIGRGWVQLWPIEGTVGNMRTAPLEADGSFRVTKVPVGRVLVMVDPAEPPASGDRFRAARIARARGFESPIRATIASPMPEPLAIDLLTVGP